LGFGGSFIRPEATGYGVVFFAEAALKDRDDDLKDKRCVVSGSGWVPAELAKRCGGSQQQHSFGIRELCGEVNGV
jgi:glutamate dehydrogenase/leucine dehydrogenase